MPRTLPIINNWSTCHTSPSDPYQPPETTTIAIQGKVYGHSGRFEDGWGIVTSDVADIRKDRWGWVVHTRSGSRYRLGTMDPKWASWMADNGVEWNPEEPIRKMGSGWK